MKKNPKVRFMKTQYGKTGFGTKDNDRWEAGNFSQGGGYYYGLGIFRASANNNDIYIGSRYGQGFSAHQAAGLFIEDGGNDFYTTRNNVTTGLAWDQSISAFIDENGNDYYDGGNYFSDKIGKIDSNHYHEGSSFSLFLDLGNDLDYYNNNINKNNTEIFNPGFGVFIYGKGSI